MNLQVFLQYTVCMRTYPDRHRHSQQNKKQSVVVKVNMREHTGSTQHARRHTTHRHHTRTHIHTHTDSEHTDTRNSQQKIKNEMKKQKQKTEIKKNCARTRTVNTPADTQSIDSTHTHIYTRTPTGNTHAQRAHRHLQLTTK